MQLLQWVHQKFQHSSIEPLKDLSIGIPTNFLSFSPQFTLKPNVEILILQTNLAPQAKPCQAIRIYDTSKPILPEVANLLLLALTTTISPGRNH